MRAVLVLAAGVAVGVGVAVVLSRTETGRAVVANVAERANAFAEAVRDGYETRTAQLYAAIDEHH